MNQCLHKEMSTFRNQMLDIAKCKGSNGMIIFFMSVQMEYMNLFHQVIVLFFFSKRKSYLVLVADLM